MKISYLHDIAVRLNHLPQGRHKHFTFITRRKKIISMGWNQSFKTHPLAAKFGHRFQSIHSELNAIQNFPYRVSELCKYDIINLRLSGNNLTIAKPCQKCRNMLWYFGVRHVGYSTFFGQYEEIEL
jgi:tRNA(Arg) A34 adenosine deaminase TadA